MSWIIDNWYILLALLAIVFVAAVAMVHFFHLPTDKQIAAIKEWLLYAVTEAEKQLGGGTGQLKLRQVYDWAVEKFPWVQFVKFETFSGWVDEALAIMREMLEKNQQIKTYVEGEAKCTSASSF